MQTESVLASSVLFDFNGLDQREQIRTAHRLVSEYGSAASAVGQLCDDSETRSGRELVARIAWLCTPEFASLGAEEYEPAMIISRSLMRSLSASTQPFDSHAIEPVTDAGFPTWRTGVPSLDAENRGGYGLAAILGEPGVGKSYLGLSSAIEAARAGWTVAHFDAELGTRERLKRLFRYAGVVDDTLRQNLNLFSVNVGAAPDVMLKHLQSVLTPEMTGLLVIGDSINRLNAQSISNASSNAYWNSFQRWVEFGRNAVKLSEGLVSFCWIAELNKQGRDKGDQLGYASNWIVRMREASEMDLVEIDNVKSRDSRRAEAVIYRRDWKTGRFVYEGMGE